MKKSRWFLMIGSVMLAVAAVFASKADTRPRFDILTAATQVAEGQYIREVYNLLHPICMVCKTAYMQLSTAAGGILGRYPLYTDTHVTEQLYVEF